VGLKQLAQTIHNNGSKVFMQINHAGSGTKIDTGYPVVGPSVIANYRSKKIPAELTQVEIKQIVEEFKQAAIRVQKAGFDGVEIHSAHGYLLDQFYSPLLNCRNDEYGGSILKRIKIHLEIIAAIKAAVGDDFPISLRLGTIDFEPTGVSKQDNQIAAKAFEKAQVALLSVSGGVYGHLSKESTAQGYFKEYAADIKKVVKLPILLTGGIVDVDFANNLIATSQADLVGIGRAVLKDVSWLNQALNTLD